jgi:peptide/nickel transport system ATP-binding protein
MIMQKDKVVQAGAARPILSDPQHPYSRQLKDAVLSPALASARDGANGGSDAQPFHAS